MNWLGPMRLARLDYALFRIADAQPLEMRAPAAFVCRIIDGKVVTLAMHCANVRLTSFYDHAMQEGCAHRARSRDWGWATMPSVLSKVGFDEALSRTYP